MEVISKLRFEHPTSLQNPFSNHNWITSSNSSTGCVHGSPLFDNSPPIANFYTAFVCIHEVNFTTIFGEWTIVAHPVAVAGDEEYQLAAHLALNAALSITRISSLG